MFRKKKLLSALLVSVLCISMAVPVHADELSDAKAEQEEIEAQKKAAEDEKSNLSATLTKIVDDMTKTKADLEAKQIELMAAQDELDIARINENEQYESMKLRIKFMYENGNDEFIEILCEAKSIGDFLNKAEYIQQISKYDRKMLVEFQNIVKDVEQKEAKLKEEEAKLTALQDTLIKDQAQVEALLADKSAEISALEEKSGKLDEVIAAAEEALRQQQAAEESARQQAAQQGSSGGSSGGNSGSPGAGQVIGSGQLAWPTTSQVITSYFGWRPIPVAGATSNHDAIDIGAAWGSPVYSSDGGTVVTASYGYNGGRGNYIMVNHGNGITTRYQHLNDIYVSVGQSVSRGQNIGTVGNTGASSGPHLDYAVYVNGVTVDPLSYL